jgi:D-amino-acid oxidase
MDDVVVLGAGVIGLTTAIGLAEQGVPVRVWAAEPPERTTSVVAGALWGPAFGEPQLGWSLAAKAEFDQLALDPSTGVRQVRGREVSDISADPPPWVDHLPDLEYCDPATLPHGMLIGLRTTVPVVTMPVYLRYLTGRLAAAGVTIELREVDRLDLAPVVVNCTGFGAAALTGDPELEPVRGQHVIVANPGIDEFYVEARAGKGAGFFPPVAAENPDADGSLWAGYFPHGDYVVVGGVAQPGETSLEPDLATAEQMLALCAEVEPRLAGAEILDHQVGLRPGRPMPRVEAERIGASTVIHNYGHGGMGVTLSWGSARAAQSLVAKLA